MEGYNVGDDDLGVTQISLEVEVTQFYSLHLCMSTMLEKNHLHVPVPDAD
jgi:hypothetical protein